MTRGSFSWVILVGHSPRFNSWVFSWVKLVGHFLGSFSWLILVGQIRGLNSWAKFMSNFVGKLVVKTRGSFSRVKLVGWTRGSSLLIISIIEKCLIVSWLQKIYFLFLWSMLINQLENIPYYQIVDTFRAQALKF